MLGIVLLTYLLHVIINADITNALDEGSFLWAQRRADNLRNDKESGVKPGRWTRSVFNWLHSPLINSIQEAFVADSIYDNSPPVTKYVKRSIRKNASDLNLEESFENEFFLWEDNEGNPLEFGLKQIQDVRPYSQRILPDYRRSNRGQTDNLWEEPLVYEYNQDVKDVDINHLSYHEKFKLNDILKNKLHNPFHHVFTFKHPTKHPSIYYTFQQATNISSTANCSTGICSTENSLKNECKNSQTNSDKIDNKNEYSSATEMSIKNVSGKKSSYYIISPNSEGNNFTELPTLTSPNSRSSSSIDSENFIAVHSKGALVPLKPWLDFHEVNLDGEETSYFLNDNLINHDPMKSYGIKKNVSNEASSHRKLRTIHHKRFLKYRRKNKRKNNKLKYPEGHSYQYELFNGNFKTSGSYYSQSSE